MRKKLKGNAFAVQCICMGLILMVMLVAYYSFANAILTAQSESVQDSLALSNLSALSTKNIDREILAKYPEKKYTIITEPSKAYNKFLDTLKINLGLNDNFEAVSEVNFIKSRVNVDRLIIYSVKDTDITKYELNSSGAFSTTMYPNSLGTVYTPANDLVNATGIYTEISFDMTYWFTKTTRVSLHEYEDMIKR